MKLVSNNLALIRDLRSFRRLRSNSEPQCFSYEGAGKEQQSLICRQVPRHINLLLHASWENQACLQPQILSAMEKNSYLLEFIAITVHLPTSCLHMAQCISQQPAVPINIFHRALSIACNELTIANSTKIKQYPSYGTKH